MNIRLPFVAGLLVAACISAVAGESYKNFPGAPADERMLRAQERVEELYERGEFERVMMICRQDLAPRGDKFAQYTIGYLYLTGKGVPQSEAYALAWYRLAAERGNSALIQVRDELFRRMKPAQIEESNRIFAGIWKEMGDSRILLRLIRADIEILNARAGTRIPGAAAGPVTVVGVSGYGGAESYYKAVEERLQTRLAYLKGNVEIVDIEQGDDHAFVRDLETGLKSEVASLDLP